MLYPVTRLTGGGSSLWFGLANHLTSILDSKVNCHRKGLGLLYLIKWLGFNNTGDATS